MSYIGNTVENQNYVPAIDYFNGDGSTTAFTLSRPVASVAAVQAVISNVPQNPGSAFTVSGSTITFTSAPPSGTANIYVYYTSPNTQVVQPGQGTVGSTQIDGNYALWNKSGSDINYTAGNVGIGTSSPSYKLHVARGSTGVVAQFANTAGASSYLYSGSGTCYFASDSAANNSFGVSSSDNYAVIYTNASERMRIDSSGRVTMPYQPHARVGKNNGNVSSPSTFVWNDVLENIGSCYNSSTGRFTAPIAGNYLLTMQCLGMTSAAAHWMWARKNGSARILTPYDSFTSGAQYTNLSSSTVVALAANDYIDWWIESGQIYGQDSWQVQMSVTLLG